MSALQVLRLSCRRSRCRLPSISLGQVAATESPSNAYAVNNSNNNNINNNNINNTQFRLWSSSPSSSKEHQQQGAADGHDGASVEGSASLLERSDKGILSRLYEKHSPKQQTDRILVAESLLQAASKQASDPRWFGPGRIPREFRSYQALLTMHIWFLHKRLILNTDDPHRAALIQEELFDIVWQDSSNRMRAHGVNEWLITKNLKTVQQYTFMHCFHYDHCYTELLDDPKERLAELKNLVLTHVLVLNPEDEQAKLDHDDQVTRIAWYIEAQYQNIIHDLPKDMFERARVAWVDLPDFSALKDARGNPMGDNPVHMDDILPEKWLRNIANDGSYYYWNVETRQAQWERPE